MITRSLISFIFCCSIFFKLLSTLMQTGTHVDLGFGTATAVVPLGWTISLKSGKMFFESYPYEFFAVDGNQRNLVAEIMIASQSQSHYFGSHQTVNVCINGLPGREANLPSGALYVLKLPNHSKYEYIYITIGAKSTSNILYAKALVHSLHSSIAGRKC